MKKISAVFISTGLAFCLWLVALSLPSKAWPQTAVKPSPQTTPASKPAPSLTPMAAADSATGNLENKSAKKGKQVKTFEWYFKRGCDCPQCKAFRERQKEAEERQKDLFQP
jgi:hypothetical protein